MGQIPLDIIKLKLSVLRVNEAKEILQQLGLSRTGRKDVLIDRIMSVFKDAATLNASGYYTRDQPRLDAAAQIIDTVFQRLVMQQQAAALSVQHLVSQKAAGGKDADAAVEPSSKRPRTEAAAQQQAGHASPQQQEPQQRHSPGFSHAGPAGKHQQVQEVISAFLSAPQGVGPSNTQVRCICAQHVPREPMLQCEGAFCGVWQHASCVKQQLEGSPSSTGGASWIKRKQFFCERCKVARADPFWEISDPLILPPVLGQLCNHPYRAVALPHGLGVANVQMSSTGLKTCVLSSWQLALLRSKPDEYKLQALCLQLDDSVPFRFHWPVMATLTVDGTPLRVFNRGMNTKLGPNQRDEPVDIGVLLPHGTGMVRQSIQLEYADPARQFVLMVYLMRRRTKEAVKALMKPAEALSAAVWQVRQHMHGHSPSKASSSSSGAAGGGPPAAAAADDGDPLHALAATAAAANGSDNGIQHTDDSDDDDIILSNTVVSLKDPNCGMRMEQPARFCDSVPLGAAFDLDTFLDIAQRTRKWMDPHSLKSSTVQNLQVDAYLTYVLQQLADHPHVTEVEINTEGLWRPAGSSTPFMSVLEPNSAAVAAAVTSAAAGSAVIKSAGGGDAAAGGVIPEVGACRAPVKPDPGAAAGVDNDDVSEEEDEMAELRRAAAEAAAARRNVLPKDPTDGVEVISLLSDSEDEGPQQQMAPPLAAAAIQRQQPPAAVQHASAAELVGRAARLPAAIGVGVGAAAGSSMLPAGVAGSGTANNAAAVGGIRIRMPNRQQQQQLLQRSAADLADSQSGALHPSQLPQQHPQQPLQLNQQLPQLGQQLQQQRLQQQLQQHGQRLQPGSPALQTQHIGNAVGSPSLQGPQQQHFINGQPTRLGQQQQQQVHDPQCLQQLQQLQQQQQQLAQQRQQLLQQQQQPAGCQPKTLSSVAMSGATSGQKTAAFIVPGLPSMEPTLIATSQQQQQHHPTQQQRQLLASSQPLHQRQPLLSQALQQQHIHRQQQQQQHQHQVLPQQHLSAPMQPGILPPGQLSSHSLIQRPSATQPGQSRQVSALQMQTSSVGAADTSGAQFPLQQQFCMQQQQPYPLEQQHQQLGLPVFTSSSGQQPHQQHGIQFQLHHQQL